MGKSKNSVTAYKVKELRRRVRYLEETVEAIKEHVSRNINEIEDLQSEREEENPKVGFQIQQNEESDD